jgi:hypothetical protein
MKYKITLIIILCFILILLGLILNVVEKNISEFMYIEPFDSMHENIIIIPQFYSIGDTFSVVGIIFFLLMYYKNIYLCTQDQTYSYFSHFFDKSPLINNRIFILNTLNNELEDKINNGYLGYFHVCNVCNMFDGLLFYNNEKIDKRFFFYNDNPLSNELPIEEKYKHSPTYRFDQEKPTINHINHYNYVGLNNTVRMDFFHYDRDIEKEKIYKKQILEQNNLTENDKYNIIYSAGQNVDNETLKKYNKNEFLNIDIHNLVDFPGWLFLLIEGAECVNLVEGSTCNFIYQSEYKKIITLKMPVYFHVWLRNRNWMEHMRLIEGWKMMTEPMLPNWTFVYENA